MTLHGLAGLPRSGSTMLATILDQHPDVHVDTASALAYTVGAVHRVVSNEPEVVVDLANPANRGRYLDAYRGLITGWHAAVSEPVVVDKCRAWVLWPGLLAACDPASKVIVCVRDPRDAVASVERAHRASPEFASAAGGTLLERVEKLMVPGGKIGEPCRQIEDLIRTRADVVWVRYESLVIDPHTHVARIVEALDLAPHTFDLDGLDRDEPAQDAQWRHKFPHRVSGPVKALGRHWSDVLPDDLAARVAASFPLFMQTFGYQEATPNGR